MTQSHYDTLPLAREREEKLREALDTILRGCVHPWPRLVAEHALKENDKARRPLEIT